MSISADNAMELSKSIIAEFHRYFIAAGVGNHDHIMAIKKIITATCSHFPNESSDVEKGLLDNALDLFSGYWLELAKEDDDECDMEEEREEASRVFLHIYRTEKDVW
ncbi:hypothetical protein M1N81_00825 [Dehalococcoidia bacterium]|nr:hypothetical protein [Dehalococcoidia bacterium]